MNLVLDANVLVSALTFPGACRTLFESCAAPHRMARSVELEDEVRRILMEKIRLPEPVIRAGLAKWGERSAMFVPSVVPVSACRDRADLHVLGLVVAFGAERLVTGDKDLLVLREFRGCAIVRPAEALRELLPTAPEQPGGNAGMAAERAPRYGRRRKRKR